MGENASRYQPPPVRADVYWRRRAIALAIGLAIFGLISWAVNGTLSTPGTVGAQAAGTAPGGGAPGSGAGGAGPASGSPATPAAAQGRPSASTPAAGRAGQVAGKTSAAGRSRQAGQGQSRQGRGRRGGHPAACPRGDVVLSLHQPHASYSGPAWPQFEVDVVSTAARPCTFNTGPRFVSVVVRTGRQALWNSAACASGTGSNVAVLTKGVPATLHFWWDRRASVPGCQGQGRRARPGAFVAAAVSGRLISNSLIFVLRAHGVAVP